MILIMVVNWNALNLTLINMHAERKKHHSASHLQLYAALVEMLPTFVAVTVVPLLSTVRNVLRIHTPADFSYIGLKFTR